jgi:two-component system response regulator VanR
MACIPRPSGDEIAKRIVASGSGMPILMLTAADRLDDKTTGFGLGADAYLTKPFELSELVLRLRALDRRRPYSRPPVREIAGLRVDPLRRVLAPRPPSSPTSRSPSTHITLAQPPSARRQS